MFTFILSDKPVKTVNFLIRKIKKKVDDKVKKVNKNFKVTRIY